MDSTNTAMGSSSETSYIDNLFININRNQINIAILGAVSAGKSTLLNTIFANTYSHCKIKRTTMTPQIYYEYDGKAQSKTSKAIREENRKINEILIKKSAAEEKITLEDIKETKYIVPPIHNFSSLIKDIYLSVYDIPGLNDAKTRDVYFEYLDKNFYKFDIIIFVIDINSALNTSDEIDILNKIVSKCERNYSDYNIHTKLLILANKCDEMSLNKHNALELDEEYEEMFEQINTQVKQTVAAKFSELEYTIIPLSSEDSYIYRILEQNPESELDMKYINKFGSMEYGRTRWNKLSEEKKKCQFKKLLSDWDMETTLNLTGFNGFKEVLNSYLTSENQKLFVNNHIIYELKNIKDNDKVDINDDIQLFYKYYLKYKSIHKRIKKGINVMEIFSDYITKYLNDYKLKVLDMFIESTKEVKICNTDKGKKLRIKGGNKYIKNVIKDESYIPQIEEVKKIMENMTSLFNGDVPIIEELNILVNSTLTEFYNDEINNKTKPVNTIYNYIQSLLGFNVEVSQTNIDNFFDNPTMINSSSDCIIAYINELESNNLLNTKTKMDKILDILIKIYRNFGKYKMPDGNLAQNVTNYPTTEYIKNVDIYSYIYYIDKFWTKFIMFNDEYDSRIDELGYLSKVNLTHKLAWCQYSLNGFNSNKSELLKLENFYIEIYTKYKDSNKKNILEEESDDEGEESGEVEEETDDDEEEEEESGEEEETDDEEETGDEEEEDNSSTSNIGNEIDIALGINS